MKEKKTDELQEIKMLLILLLVKLGTTSDELAMALDMHPGAVRNLISINKVRKLTKQE